MSRTIKEALREALPPHTQIYIMYGATEAAARLSYLEPEKYLNKLDSIGKAIPGVMLRVVAEDGRELPPGQTGELVAEGPNIMQGYWRDREGTRRVLDKSGRYHTGDQAYRDVEGYYFVIGRKDDQLKVGGHRVNPHEIEEVLMESGMLLEVAVLGLPDQLLGYRMVACAVPRNGLSGQQLLSFCSERLARYKIPSDVVSLRSLPKNSNGKIDRVKCLELLKNRAT